MPREMSREAIMNEFDRRVDKVNAERTARNQARRESVAARADMIKYGLMQFTKAEILESAERQGAMKGVKPTMKKDDLAGVVAMTLAELQIEATEQSAEYNGWAWMSYTVKRTIEQAAEAKAKFAKKAGEYVNEGRGDSLAREANTAQLKSLEAELWWDVLYLWIEMPNKATFAECVEHVMRYSMKHGGHHRGGFSEHERTLGREAFFNWTDDAVALLPKMAAFNDA